MPRENDDLERILSEIREEPVDPAVIEQAAGRVWERMAHTPLASCADFQALMPDYRAGRLPEARALLLKDHTHECVACRKALEGRKVAAFPAEKRRWFSVPSVRWAMAAALALGVGISAWQLMLRLSPSKTVIQAVNGTLYTVAGQGTRALGAGAELSGGELRTARDSSAVVRLADGSLVEAGERSAFTVSEAGRDLTIHLARGSVIVQAAKRRSGHLYVVTPDCRVAVTGTVFSVASGSKGSRVSVVEGEVRVAQGNETKVLRRGDQYVSSAAVTPMPVREDIAWSRNFNQHSALLGELATLQKKLETVRMPEGRYTSRILPMLPADTVVYLAFPNLGGTLAETQRIVRQRMQESPVLREWWDKLESQRGSAALDGIIERVRAASEYLGDEIVMAVPRTGDRVGQPVFLAEVRRNGFREFIEGQMREAGGGKQPLRIAESVEALGPVARGEAVMMLRPDMAAISPDAASLRLVLEGNGGFAATPFGARVAETYRDGAGFVFAADLERMNMRPPAGHHEDKTGFTNVKYTVVEQKENAGRTDTHAVVAFGGQRTGISSWLAKPAPIGALDYVSPEATLVWAAALKSPARMFDDLFNSAEALSSLAKAQSELGLNIRDELAAPLGGEFAVALDGPLVPVPSWKLAVEVYDPARFQAAIRKLVDAYNRHAATHGAPAAQFVQEPGTGRVWYKLTLPQWQTLGEVSFTFADGYLVAAPSRALVERALQYRASGYTLTRSAAFVALVPRDRYVNFSAVAYQNVGSNLGSLLDALGAGQKKAPGGIAADLGKPMLVTAYGEDDRITLASTGSLFSLNPANLLRLGGPLGAFGKRQR